MTHLTYQETLAQVNLLVCCDITIPCLFTKSKRNKTSFIYSNTNCFRDEATEEDNSIFTGRRRSRRDLIIQLVRWFTIGQGIERRETLQLHKYHTYLLHNVLKMMNKYKKIISRHSLAGRHLISHFIFEIIHFLCILNIKVSRRLCFTLPADSMRIILYQPIPIPMASVLSQLE